MPILSNSLVPEKLEYKSIIYEVSPVYNKKYYAFDLKINNQSMEKFHLNIGKDIIKQGYNKGRGSFKIRGSLNKLLSLNNEQKSNGVIAMSAGNHSQGVAYSAKIMGIKATIVMPDNTPFAKIRKTSELGAKVIIHGNTLNDSEMYVLIKYYLSYLVKLKQW